ncbi:YdaS family helix-turn-helix protein [Polynucleobacter sp. Fuers-14]|uniref:transcriptional regulator n=1 Tax=Polynucleobacter sp. Fuers-14 TaxID=1758364 RepID=UPI001C0DE0D9|nr:YdaS family helix-turn-helix protein [Polynucleobacter sp. Fuers-14]MBU3640961.1 helix-turn-helix domain-containing protein [Polynucleobacter sp. Fuers-14]
MKLNEYLSSQGHGAISALAKAINGYPSDISSYIREAAPKPIPTKTCVAIEKVTQRVVTRQELRPNDYWLHWPDLAPPEISIPPIPEACKDSLPVLRSLGRLQDDRAIAHFLNLPKSVRCQLFNKTPLSQQITEEMCLKAGQAFAGAAK